jgi:hypothetical protein
MLRNPDVQPSIYRPDCERPDSDCNRSGGPREGNTQQVSGLHAAQRHTQVTQLAAARTKHGASYLPLLFILIFSPHNILSLSFIEGSGKKIRSKKANLIELCHDV